MFLINFFRRLLAFPKGNNVDYLSLYLEVADFEPLPSGWRRYVKLQLTVVKQVSEKGSAVKGDSHWSLLTFFILLNSHCQVKILKCQWHIYIYTHSIDIISSIGRFFLSFFLNLDILFVLVFYVAQGCFSDLRELVQYIVVPPLFDFNFAIGMNCYSNTSLV